MTAGVQEKYFIRPGRPVTHPAFRVSGGQSSFFSLDVKKKKTGWKQFFF